MAGGKTKDGTPDTKQNKVSGEKTSPATKAGANSNEKEADVETTSNPLGERGKDNGDHDPFNPDPFSREQVYDTRFSLEMKNSVETRCDELMDLHRTSQKQESFLDLELGAPGGPLAMIMQFLRSQEKLEEFSFKLGATHENGCLTIDLATYDFPRLAKLLNHMYALGITNRGDDPKIGITGWKLIFDPQQEDIRVQSCVEPMVWMLNTSDASLLRSLGFVLPQRPWENANHVPPEDPPMRGEADDESKGIEREDHPPEKGGSSDSPLSKSPAQHITSPTYTRTKKEQKQRNIQEGERINAYMQELVEAFSHEVTRGQETKKSGTHTNSMSGAGQAASSSQGVMGTSTTKTTTNAGNTGFRENQNKTKKRKRDDEEEKGQLSESKVRIRNEQEDDGSDQDCDEKATSNEEAGEKQDEEEVKKARKRRKLDPEAIQVSNDGKEVDEKEETKKEKSKKTGGRKKKGK